METTLEVRWFIRGMPPVVVQRWFKFECPGKFLHRTKTREDWYASSEQNYLNKLKNYSFRNLKPEEINLKLRQEYLELKLREQEFGTHGFGYKKHSPICEGKVEQWRKFEEQELRNAAILRGSLAETNWISVDKEREQKIEQGVKSELTWLKINHESWWTVAFEMTQSEQPNGIASQHSQQKDSCFKEVVEAACKTYYGPKLSATNSCGYSAWLLKFAPIGDKLRKNGFTQLL